MCVLCLAGYGMTPGWGFQKLGSTVAGIPDAYLMLNQKKSRVDDPAWRYMVPPALLTQVHTAAEVWVCELIKYTRLSWLGPTVPGELVHAHLTPQTECDHESIEDRVKSG